MYCYFTFVKVLLPIVMTTVNYSGNVRGRQVCSVLSTVGASGGQQVQAESATLERAGGWQLAARIVGGLRTRLARDRWTSRAVTLRLCIALRY